MKLKITKSDKKALLAALAVCGIGILFSILIVLGMAIYRKHTYTSVILPDAYRITDMKATAHTSYSVNGSNTDYVYIITVKYEIDAPIILGRSTNFVGITIRGQGDYGTYVGPKTGYLGDQFVTTGRLGIVRFERIRFE